jgi:hypothetical protein
MTTRILVQNERDRQVGVVVEDDGADNAKPTTLIIDSVVVFVVLVLLPIDKSLSLTMLPLPLLLL